MTNNHLPVVKSTSQLAPQTYLPGLDLVAAFVENTPEGKSNTAELFDALITFSMDHAREGQRFIEAQKVFRGRHFGVQISPATIKRNGKPVLILPGIRENLIEKALRKIAAEDMAALKVTEQGGHAEVWVKFTMYQLRRILSSQGHSFNIAQLEEGLQVLQGAQVKITGEVAECEEGAISHILQTVVWRKKTSGDEEGRSHKNMAKFHPFITQSILQKTFRQIDFAKLMRPKNELARWLYTRLSHNYTQASEDDFMKWQMGDPTAGYHLSLQTIIRENGLRFRDTSTALKSVRTALKALRQQDVLRGTDWRGEEFIGWTEKIQFGFSKGGRRPINDVVFHLFPSVAVVDDIIKANTTARTLRRK